MALLIRLPTARTHAAVHTLCLIAAAGGCSKPFGDLGSADQTTTEATSGGATEDPTVADTTTSEPQGPPDEWDDQLEPQAGTRLRPILRTAEDGATQHVAWHDTKEDIRCSFRSGDDGVRRCYPEQWATAPYVYYADPECKIPVMKTYDGYPHDILEIEGEDWCVPGKLYRLDPEPYVGTLYRDEGWDGCFKHSEDPGYYKGTEMTPDQFVAAEVEPAEGISRIVPLILAAEDGARAIVGAWDREHSEEVAAQPGTDAQAWRWFGRYAATSATLFSDAACTAPLAGSRACTPPDRTPTTAQAVVFCQPQAPQRWRLDEPFTQEQVFQGNACNPSSTEYWDQLWTVGEALTDEDFGLVTSAPVGGTRLTRELHGNPEGEPFLGADLFFDPELGEPCRFNYNAVNETSRCEPLVSGTTTNIYLDAACTQQVAYVISPELDCPAPPAKWAINSETVRPLLEPTGWGKFKLEDGACVVADGAFDYPGGLGEHTVYTVGPPSDITLVKATDVVQ